jgi:hypothetical protein
MRWKVEDRFGPKGDVESGGCENFGLKYNNLFQFPPNNKYIRHSYYGISFHVMKVVNGMLLEAFQAVPKLEFLTSTQRCVKSQNKEDLDIVNLDAQHNDETLK